MYSIFDCVVTISLQRIYNLNNADLLGVDDNLCVDTLLNGVSLHYYHKCIYADLFHALVYICMQCYLHLRGRFTSQFWISSNCPHKVTRTGVSIQLKRARLTQPPSQGHTSTARWPYYSALIISSGTQNLMYRDPRLTPRLCQVRGFLAPMRNKFI